MSNKTILFKAIPHGVPVEGQDLEVVPWDFDHEASPPPGGITLRILAVSLDPYMRGRMRSPEIKSYVSAYKLGEPIDSRGMAQVIKSDSKDYQPGDFVRGWMPIANYSAAPEPLLRLFEKITPPTGVDPMMYLGPLGMTGMTAFGSLYEIAEMKKGDVIWVSSAAGAVGQLVGQIALHEGLTVIGSVGSDEKLEYITKVLGFTHGFNYKKEKLGEALARLAPKGIDIYYDNVGGEHLETAIHFLNDHGRIVACGMISQYNVTAETSYKVRNLTSIVSKRLKIQGFIQSDFEAKYNKRFRETVEPWVASGEFKPKIQVYEGIENGIQSFLKMLNGENFGKTVLKIADLDTEAQARL